MKALFVLLAATLLQFSPALADDGTKHVPDPDTIEHHSAGNGCWTCTTRNKYREIYVIFGQTREQAEQVTMDYCVSNGGPKSMCRRHLKCQFENTHHPGGETPQEVQPFYDWGRGADGYGYCYLFDDSGVMNNGKAVGNFMCDMTKTRYEFMPKKDGSQACYQVTPYGHIMDQGLELDPVRCRKGKDFPQY